MKHPKAVPARRYLRPLLLVAFAASAVDLAANFLLDGSSLSQPARVGIALMPLPGCIALLVMILRIVRNLDEFQKRVQFEAVVTGFLSTSIVVFVYGYLQRAHAVGPINLGLVWVSMIVFYAIGYFVAVSHYQ